MPEVEESLRGVVDPLWVRDPRDTEGGSWGGEKRSCCCGRFSGVTLARGSVDGDMLGRRDCTKYIHRISIGRVKGLTTHIQARLQETFRTA